jgi:hypothetical protein
MERQNGRIYRSLETEGWRKMMKKNFGKKNWMFPMPVLMIGTYNYDPGAHVYRIMSEEVAKAFSCGKEIC